MREVTAAVVNSLGVAPPAVRVLLEEVSPEHWSVGGISKAEPVSGGGVTPPTGDVR
ncbi:tautomerase family protein [Rhizobium rhizogenes]|uniref:tautomerase family protein n=2 Tax=Rhizobium/Agrobacterium group TaxID=227290 RepID=UPI0035AC1304